MRDLFEVTTDGIDCIRITRRTKRHYWTDDFTGTEMMWAIKDRHFNTYEAAYHAFRRLKEQELEEARTVVAMIEDCLHRVYAEAYGLLQ